MEHQLRSPRKSGFTPVPSSDAGFDDHEPTQPAGYFSRPSILRSIIAGLSITIFALLYVIAVQDSRRSDASTNRKSQDIIRQGNPVQRKFVEAFNYSDPTSHAAHLHELWPGYTAATVRVAVESPRAYGLGPGFPSADESVEFFVPAYIHQAHCLRLLRNNYWKNEEPRPPRSPEEIEQEHVHVEHCYDYLRQAILCLVDTTLEGPAHDEGGSASNTDGMGVMHHCRDMEHVQEEFRALKTSAHSSGRE